MEICQSKADLYVELSSCRSATCKIPNLPNLSCQDQAKNQACLVMRCLLESSMPDPPVKSMPEQPRTPSYPAAGHAGMDATAGLPMRKLQQAGYALSMPMAPVEAPAMAMAPAPDAAPEPAMSPVPSMAPLMSMSSRKMLEDYQDADTVVVDPPLDAFDYDVTPYMAPFVAPVVAPAVDPAPQSPAQSPAMPPPMGPAPSPMQAPAPVVAPTPGQCPPSTKPTLRTLLGASASHQDFSPSLYI